MSSDLVIEARGLSKRFKLYRRPGDRFFEWITLGTRTLHEDFWALRDVDVTLRHGEKLGIIGANGSGKSTLLKMLAGSLTPTSGSCTVTGRAFALIELSTGFNHDLTGRENISFVGMMLGLDREYIERRKEQIIEFADIGDFIDRPVRLYSSGMFVRLAFSLFAFLDPDLLMIDEAFAVGDADFKEKSYRLMRSMVRTKGRSVIFVSHSMTTIESVCDRVMWLEHGRCVMDDEPRRVIEAYRERNKERKQERREREQSGGRASAGPETDGEAQSPLLARERDLPVFNVPPRRKQLTIEKGAVHSDVAAIAAIWLQEKDGAAAEQVGAHRKFAIGCVARFQRDGDPVFGVRIIGADGAAVTALDTADLLDDVPPAKAGEERVVRWPIARGLPPGAYVVECWVKAGDAMASAKARLQVGGPPRVDATFNLVMRPSMGRAAHGR